MTGPGFRISNQLRSGGASGRVISSREAIDQLARRDDPAPVWVTAVYSETGVIFPGCACRIMPVAADATPGPAGRQAVIIHAKFGHRPDVARRFARLLTAASHLASAASDLYREQRRAEAAGWVYDGPVPWEDWQQSRCVCARTWERHAIGLDHEFALAPLPGTGGRGTTHYRAAGMAEPPCRPGPDLYVATAHPGEVDCRACIAAMPSILDGIEVSE